MLRIDYTIKSRFVLPILSLTHSAKSLSLKNKSLEYKKIHSCNDSKKNTKQQKEENIVEAPNHNLIEKREIYVSYYNS